MAINTKLLIAAPMLQDYLVDKDTGFPLAGGIVSMYKDTSRSFYKNWYYQTGIPGDYTWVALDNPLQLSSVGTIQDPNGNDVIPFYYPFSETNSNQREAYYVTIYSVDSNGDPAVLQFTRENFPFDSGSGSTPSTNDLTLRNYITNNVYYRNIGSLNATNVTNIIIAPSQHDGFNWALNSDIRFIKDITGATDNIAFLPMVTTLTNDITPELYLNFVCSGVQLGESRKGILYPICLHVDTLQNQLASIVIQAQNVSGSPNNYIDVKIYQYTGTGALSPSTYFPFGDDSGHIVLTDNFDKYVLTDFLPDASTLSLGQGGDDALFLFIQYPLSVVCAINHTKPQLYLGLEVATNDFDTYDEIGAVIDSNRTGDYRTSLNTFQPAGWVAANDGTIGATGSGASTRANNDTYPLYQMLYDYMTDHWAPVSGGRTTDPYTDFVAGKTITLARSLGRVLAGANPQYNLYQSYTANAATDQITLPSPITYQGATVRLTTGTPVTFTNTGGTFPSPLVANTVYFISVNSSSGTVYKLSTTVENAYAGTDINLTTNGTGSNVMNNAMGCFVGESNHTLTIPEMPNHAHFLDGQPGIGGGGYVSLQGSGLGTQAPVGTIEAIGGSGSHNTIQPSTYMNVFIKL